MKAQGIQGAQVFKNVYGFYLEVGNYKIPITQKGGMHLRFAGPSGKYKFISAVDVLNHSVRSADLAEKIVFIGSSAVGLNDVHHTLFDSQFPGVETHGVIVDNIHNNAHIIRPIWSEKVVFSVTILTGLVMTLLFFSLPGPLLFFMATLAWICLVFFSSLFSYLKLSVFVSPGAPALMAVVLFSCLAYARFVLARRASFLWFKRLAGAQQLTMEAMVNMVETRDPETGQHIQRTQYYARSLALALKRKGQFSEILTDHYIEKLFLSAPLHDIGKVGIPDNILLKPGKLTDEEFTIMKTHATHGEKIVGKVAKKIKGDNYLGMGAEIAGSHHERWDGKGYPRGLSLEEIPLSGRIMAISDVYDALISRRCYKPPFSHEKAMAIIGEGKGSSFDPVIVDAFVTIEPEIIAIAARYEDSMD
jgi:adenylate cyclase